VQDIFSIFNILFKKIISRMIRLLFSICFICAVSLCYAQAVVDFEQYNLSKGQYLNGSDQSGGFYNDNIFLYNYYNTEFFYWSGWSISATTDTVTASFTNEYSAASGGGADASLTYAVSYGLENKIVLKGDARGKPIKSISINNGTYPALSMKNGDSFAKKFGGISGNDKDYFYVTIKAWYQGQLSVDSIDFYLADYRFDDKGKDYIIRKWTAVDLTSLGNIDSLLFVLHSSDVGDFGINTPTYFCLDNIRFNTEVATADVTPIEVVLTPNPTLDFIKIQSSAKGESDYVVYNLYGAIVSAGKATANTIDMTLLKSGTYIVKITNGHDAVNRQIVKL
jgi:Domain of unknown function (DUF4465)/Secretion system C-terminal sorting domain